MVALTGSSAFADDDSLLRGGGRRHRQYRVQRFSIVRGAQLVDDRRLAQQPGDAGQCLEVIGAGAFGRQQKKDQIDRLAVERLEIDRPVEPREQSEQAAEVRHLAVRNGDAVADGRGAELFALHQDLENGLLALAGQHGGARRKLVQRLLLVVDLERRQDRVRCNEIVERHESDLKAKVTWKLTWKLTWKRK